MKVYSHAERRWYRLTLAGLVLALLAGCPAPAPQPPPAPDASDGGPVVSADCEAAAEAMRAAGCPVSARTLAKVEADRLFRVECDSVNAASCPALTCARLALARSTADVRALGIACADGGP